MSLISAVAFATFFIKREVGFIQINVRTNERIRAPEVLVIGPEGENLGVMKNKDALELARVKYNLDLVEVAPNANPPVCRIMDYGRWKYEQEQKLKKARKHQTQTVIKEVKMRPKIGAHDLEIKKRRIEEFLKKGAKVKVTLRFRGREIVHAELGEKLLKQLSEGVSDYGVVESQPKMDGRAMIMVLSPRKKEPHQVAEEKSSEKKE